MKKYRIDDLTSLAVVNGQGSTSPFKEHPIDKRVTPWGIQAITSHRSLQIAGLVFVFRGPENNPLTADCWFNAVLGFGLALFNSFLPKLGRLLELAQKKNERLVVLQDGEFLSHLHQFYSHWLSDEQHSNSVQWMPKLVQLHKLMQDHFQKAGFMFGENHCALKATQTLLQMLKASEDSIHFSPSFRSNFSLSSHWKVRHISCSWDHLLSSSFPDQPQQDDPQFLIYLNETYSSLPSDWVTLRIGHNKYQLWAWISFEELVYDTKLQETVNHFTCCMVASNPSELWIYDDLLHLKPGGYQGVLLHSDKHKTAKLWKQVPVVLFRRSDQQN